MIIQQIGNKAGREEGVDVFFKTPGVKENG